MRPSRFHEQELHQVYYNHDHLANPDSRRSLSKELAVTDVGCDLGFPRQPDVSSFVAARYCDDSTAHVLVLVSAAQFAPYA